MNALRILIADDHDLMRGGVRTLLQSHAGWEICGEAQTGRDAVEKAETLKPDIAILDIGMPDLDGLAAAREIRNACPKTRIVVLSMHHSDQLIRDTVEAGAQGYVMKSDSERDLVRAVEALANHKPFFTAQATEVAESGIPASAASVALSRNPSKDRLTPREKQVVQLLCDGSTSKEVGEQLGISVKTAETHRANILRKLEMHSVTELVRYALRNQIVA